MIKTLPFSLFSFSYPPNLREMLRAENKKTTNEKITVLRSKCKEVLLVKGTKSIEEIKNTILDNYHDKYIILHVDYDDFMFKDGTNEILLRRQGKEILFRIFSKENLEIYEVLFYLIYKGLDVNTIAPYQRHSGPGRTADKTDWIN